MLDLGNGSKMRLRASEKWNACDFFLIWKIGEFGGRQIEQRAD